MWQKVVEIHIDDIQGGQLYELMAINLMVLSSNASKLWTLIYYTLLQIRV